MPGQLVDTYVHFSLVPQAMGLWVLQAVRASTLNLRLISFTTKVYWFGGPHSLINGRTIYNEFAFGWT